MGFLRRLLGGGASSTERADASDPAGEPKAAESDPEADERAHELDLARFEQDRTDELMRRQQRYANYSWTPSAQGGERRADETEAGSD